MPRILYADHPLALLSLQHALAEHFDVHATSRMEEAKTILEQGVDLIICGLYFDDPDVVTFIEMCAQDERTARIPLVCVRVWEHAGRAG